MYKRQGEYEALVDLWYDIADDAAPAIPAPTAAAEAIAELAKYDTVAEITADNYGKAVAAVEAAKKLKPSDAKDDDEWYALQDAIAAVEDAIELKEATEAVQAGYDKLIVDTAAAATGDDAWPEGAVDAAKAAVAEKLATMKLEELKALKPEMSDTIWMSVIVPVGEEMQAEATVETYEELTAAIANSKVKTIILANDIVLDAKIEIGSGRTLDGNKNTIDASKVRTTTAIVIGDGCTVKNLTVEGNTRMNSWDSNYGIQAYGNNTKATLENVTVTGFDAAILVNGAELTLEKTVDVSGNEFGGIEVSKGEGITTNAKLIVEGTVVNETESDTAPTAWIPCTDKDGNGAQGSIEGVKWTETMVKKDDDKFQLWYTIND